MDRLIDLVQLASKGEVETFLRKLANSLLRMSDFISKDHQRTDHSVTLINLLNATALYVKELSRSMNGHISTIATCARGIYEINLRVRDVLESGDGMSRWHGEAVTDKLQLLEGILASSDASDDDPRRITLLVEIQRLKELRSRYNLPDEKIARADSVANKTGMGDEHKAIYKLLSKLAHPSSYVVNNHAEASSDEFWNVLVVRAQLSALDTFHRIGSYMEVPDELLQPPRLNVSKKRRRR